MEREWMVERDSENGDQVEDRRMTFSSRAWWRLSCVALGGRGECVFLPPCHAVLLTIITLFHIIIILVIISATHCLVSPSQTMATFTKVRWVHRHPRYCPYTACSRIAGKALGSLKWVAKWPYNSLTFTGQACNSDVAMLTTQEELLAMNPNPRVMILQEEMRKLEEELGCVCCMRRNQNFTG
jgi:hypothetical protein